MFFQCSNYLNQYSMKMKQNLRNKVEGFCQTHQNLLKDNQVHIVFYLTNGSFEGIGQLIVCLPHNSDVPGSMSHSWDLQIPFSWFTMISQLPAMYTFYCTLQACFFQSGVRT